MARKPRETSPAADSSASSEDLNAISWKFVKTMNMHDLSRDDDYLSHLFVEKLSSFASAPLLVHKMDPTRRLPKTDASEIVAIVQKLVRAKPAGSPAIRQAVNELLIMAAVQYFIREYDQRQINAFATHASRYLELYTPNGSIEIAQTSRYSKWTGKNELCILATRSMPVGYVITELKGSMADLTDEEDRELKRTGTSADGGPRRDFSVIHSKQMKKNHLFLGPARFVNHDCDNNCELFRNGRYITFRAIKPIAVGQEITAHYGNGYFGRNNRHCLCETCERNGRGGYAPQAENEVPVDGNDTDSSDSDSDTSSVVSIDPSKEIKLNLNQRSTRRGVYLTIPESTSDDDDDGDDSEAEVINELGAGPSGQLTPLLSTSNPGTPELKKPKEEPVDVCIPPLELSRHALDSMSPSLLSPLSPATSDKSSFKSVIVTRSQKARAESTSTTASHLATPPLSASSGPRTRSVSFGGNARNAGVHASGSVSASASITVVSPVKRGRGRPRKYPLPDKASTSAPSPTSTSQPKSKSNTPLTDSQRGSAAVEQRHLRLRKSILANSALAKSASTPDLGSESEVSKPKEPTGPTCATCSCSLPVPVEESISAGVKRKRKLVEEKQDCLRCKRHFFIYGAPWPRRIPIPGSFSSESSRETTPSVRDVLTSAKERDERRKKKQGQDDPLASLDQKLLALSSKLGIINGTGSSGTFPFHGPVTTWIEETTRAIFEGKKHIKLPDDLMDRLVKKGIVLFEERAETEAIEAGRVYKPGKWKEIVSLEVWEQYGHLYEEVYGKVGEEELREMKRRKLEGCELEVMSVDGNPRTPELEIDVDVVDEDGDDRRDKDFWPAPELPPPGLGMKRLGALTMRPSPVVVSRWRSSPLRNSYSAESTPTLVDDDTDDNDGTSDEHASTPENDTPAEVLVDDSVSAVSAESVPASPHVDLVALPSDTEDEAVEVHSHSASALSKTPKPNVPVLKGLGLGLKPSPLALSRRIWAPAAAIIVDGDGDDDGVEPSISLNGGGGGGVGLSPPVSTGLGLGLGPPRSLKRRAPDGERRASDGSGNGSSPRGHRSSKSRRVLDEMEDLSGEEDVIIPGPPNSALYKLQSKVMFEGRSSNVSTDMKMLDAAFPRAVTPVRERPGEIIDLTVTPKAKVLPTTPPRMKDIFSTPPKKSPTRPYKIGDLQSDFLQTASPSLARTSISLVRAGWESDCSV